MKIRQIDFPIFIIIIMIAILIGMIYIMISMKKNNKLDSNIYLYFFVSLLLIIFMGKMYTFIFFKETNFLSSSLSSYGGALGLLLSTLYYDKLLKLNNLLLKNAIISGILMYSIAKIACFIVGCCFGIPYNGIFHVVYVDRMNIPVFPIQILETIIFMIIFVVCHKYKDHHNIILLAIIGSAFSKFLLDFLRYDHVDKLITTNQIFSIIIMIFGLIMLFYENKKEVLSN